MVCRLLSVVNGETGSCGIIQGSCRLSHVQLFETPWTVAHQAPLSMEFPRQEDWNGLPFSSPGDLPDPGIKPRSPALSYALFCFCGISQLTVQIMSLGFSQVSELI